MLNRNKWNKWNRGNRGNKRDNEIMAKRVNLLTTNS